MALNLPIAGGMLAALLATGSVGTLSANAGELSGNTISEPARRLAQDTSESGAWGVETLKDISQLEVKLSKISACGRGRDSETWNSIIESFLQRQGLPIVEGNEDSPNPRLIILIDCMFEEGAYILSIQFSLSQPVNLNGQNIQADTYGLPGIFGIVPTSQYVSTEQEVISNLLNKFIKDWNASRNESS